MESIVLNEEVLNKIPENKKAIFILEWLRNLNKFLSTAQKNDIKDCQKRLVDQLVVQIQKSPGPPIRQLIAKCLATLFNVGDTFLLFDAVNKCNDILKNRDDSPSFLPTRLAAITCIGVMYQRLGRLMGRSYEETVSLLLKSLKNAESQTRCETFLTLEMIVGGMGAAASASHRDIFKAVRHGMVDRVMAVRSASADCLRELVKHAQFLYTTEIESVFSICFRSFEGSNYTVRCSVAHVLAQTIAVSQQATQASVGKSRLVTLDEVLTLLASGFLRGGIGFLKGSSATEMIKGGSSVTREIRIGVTHAYALLVSCLGTKWLDKNLSLFISHLLDLLANPKSVTSHVEAVYSRKFVSFVINSSVARQMGEKTQGQAIKELISIINRYTKQDSDVARDNSNGDVQGTQHVLICALTQVGVLTERLGTSCSILLNESSLGILDTIVSVLVHSVPSVRVAGAWCLRCISVACPSSLTPLIERCLERLETLRSSPEAINGYSLSLSALFGASRQTPLGIPYNKGKLVFNIAEDMLRSASQNSRLSLQRTQSGWLLIGSLITLGPSVVRGLLPRILLLWKNSFPRSSKELESEKSRGDCFTWQLTLENRAGALSAMTSLLLYCRPLVTDEVRRRMLTQMESAVGMLTSLSPLFKSSGPAVKASAVSVRLRLYETLLLLSAHLYENLYTNLLRLLVSEFTLTENAANTTTSLLLDMCYADDDVILESWVLQTDHKTIESQIISNGFGTGAVEHDVTSLYKMTDGSSEGPYALGVAVIDNSCLLFAHIFPFVANKHRVQMLNHFSECIKHAKSTRQEAIQINILTALLGSLKICSEMKLGIGSPDVKTSCQSLLMGLLSHPNPVIRCASCQSVGRLAHLEADGRFVSELVQACFDKLKTARDAYTRTGHSLTLGCIQRHVSSLGSSQNLNASVSILLALSQDSASPVVQVWALRALSLLADSGGPMFKSYVEPSCLQSLRLLMTAPFYHWDVHQSIGRLVATIIVAVGPELQGDGDSNMNSIRSLLLSNCGLMQDQKDPMVRAGAVGCLQQLHMFSPKLIQVSSLMPILCDALESQHLFLRRGAASCLHQLTQINAKEVCDEGLNWTKSHKTSQSEFGLPGLLFSRLDLEVDPAILDTIQKMITGLVQSLATSQLQLWLSICREALATAESNSALSSPDRETEGEDGDVDDEDLYFKASEEKSINSNMSPKWRSRVFATETLRRIITSCETSVNRELHFDLSLAKEKRKTLGVNETFLVLHVSDLIRMSFMAATSDSDPLRLEGLKCLKLIIEKFSSVAEPEFPNHVILEQFQAQVGAALRPAFSSDTPSHVTATACEVCSTWIGSGVARDLNDLRRVHQLLVSSLVKLQKDSNSRQYNETSSTLEKLSILKAWAEVYVVAMSEEEAKQRKKRERINSRRDSDDEDDEDMNPLEESLLQLVSPELNDLSSHWLAALKDHALLSLPSEYSSQLPHDGGAFYASDTMDAARPLYRQSWPQILYAASLWLCSTQVDVKHEDSDRTKDFHLLLGICLEALCTPKSTDPLSNVVICLKSLQTLLKHKVLLSLMTQDKKLIIELCSILHRLILTRDSPACQILVLNISSSMTEALLDMTEDERKSALRKLAPANQKQAESEIDVILSNVGEGGQTGVIKSGESVVYSLLEVCLCVLVRQLPELTPVSESPVNRSNHSLHNHTKVTLESSQLISTSLEILSRLPELCSPNSSVMILPTILHLMTGVLRESVTISEESIRQPIILSLLDSFERLGSSKLLRNSICCNDWIQQLQSSLSQILDMCNSSQADERRPDEITIIAIIGVFISKCSPEVVSVPNLLFPSINMLKQRLQQSSSEMVQLKCLETIKVAFKHEDKRISVAYIHALGPRIVEMLNRMSQHLEDVQFLSKSRYELLVSGVDALESLVSIAEAEKRIDVLALLVPLVVKFLSENMDSFRGKSLRYMVHNFALEKVIAIGPLYPKEFKEIMGNFPKVRSKLEFAIKNRQNAASHAYNRLSTSTTDRSSFDVQKNDAPIIKLKTDFSHFN